MIKSAFTEFEKFVIPEGLVKVIERDDGPAMYTDNAFLRELDDRLDAALERRRIAKEQSQEIFEFENNSKSLQHGKKSLSRIWTKSIRNQEFEFSDDFVPEIRHDEFNILVSEPFKKRHEYTMMAEMREIPTNNSGFDLRGSAA